MRDSVIVPLYRDAPAQPNPLRAEVARTYADCTRVGGGGQELLVEDRGPTEESELQAVPCP
jgi:hypothetical protein